MALICKDCGEEWNGRMHERGRARGGYKYHCQCGSQKKPTGVDDEILAQNVRLAKQKQGQQDSNRIERKSFREYARIENAVEAYAKEIIKVLRKHGGKLETTNNWGNCLRHENNVGIIQISDTHFNELVDLPHNKYDMTVASHRLFKLAKEAIFMFKAKKVKKILVAFTGDLLNSDRRLDELLNQATNRAKATFVSVMLVKAFLEHLNAGFDVTVVSVLGNESRVGKEMPFSNEALSDNYDYTIMNMVRLLLEDSGVHFGSLDTGEAVVDVAGQKILMTHGISKATDTQLKTQAAIGRYCINGVDIDHIIEGHLHSTKIGLYSSRSGSLVGSNSFNEMSMGLAGRATQNIYLASKDSFHKIAVDLQNYVDGEWYNIYTELMEYNCKSAGKNKVQTKIMEIVV